MAEQASDDSADSLTVSSIGEAGAEHLSLGVIWAYSLPRIGFGVMGLLFVSYLVKFSTDVLLIAPAAMGALIFASRLWDAVSDPLAGYLSDKTRSRYGRRRVWMFASAVPVGLGIIMIWSPPTFLDGLMLIAWMGAALLIYETASTAFFVPHGALGIELTPNFHERTRLFGYIHMIVSLGSLLGIGTLYLLDSAEDKRSTAVYISIFAGVFVSSLILWATMLLPERADYQGRGALNPYKSFSDVFRNPHALLLLCVYFIETFGASSIAMLVPYLVEYVIPKDNMPVAPSVFMVSVLIIYFVPQVIFTPLWIKLSRVVGKKSLWAFSMWLSGFVFVGYFFALQMPIMIWVLSFCLGLAGGIGAVIAPAIKADIIDYDEYKTGERKEGAYYAVWNMVRKGAASLTAIVTGFVLQSVGFEPNAEQTEATKFALRALFALLPACGYLIGAALFMRFKFNEAEHAHIRQLLQDRKLT